MKQINLMQRNKTVLLLLVFMICTVALGLSAGTSGSLPYDVTVSLLANPVKVSGFFCAQPHRYGSDDASQ